MERKVMQTTFVYGPWPQGREKSPGRIRASQQDRAVAVEHVLASANYLMADPNEFPQWVIAGPVQLFDNIVVQQLYRMVTVEDEPEDEEE